LSELETTTHGTFFVQAIPNKNSYESTSPVILQSDFSPLIILPNIRLLILYNKMDHRSSSCFLTGTIDLLALADFRNNNPLIDMVIDTICRFCHARGYSGRHVRIEPDFHKPGRGIDIATSRKLENHPVRAPAYAGQFQTKEEVCVRIRPEEIIIIPNDEHRA
jgi:hypothetical protein